MTAWYPCAVPGSQTGSWRSSAWISRIPLERGFEGDRLVDPRQPRLVREQPAHRDGRLPRGAELGPVLDDRGVDVERAVLGEVVRRDRRRALRRREHERDRVARPRRAPSSGRPPRPTGRRRARRGDTPRTPRPPRALRRSSARTSSRTCSKPGAVQPSIVMRPATRRARPAGPRSSCARRRRACPGAFHRRSRSWCR